MSELRFILLARELAGDAGDSPSKEGVWYGVAFMTLFSPSDRSSDRPRRDTPPCSVNPFSSSSLKVGKPARLYYGPGGAKLLFATDHLLALFWTRRQPAWSSDRATRAKISPLTANQWAGPRTRTDRGPDRLAQSPAMAESAPCPTRDGLRGKVGLAGRGGPARAGVPWVERSGFRHGLSRFTAS